VNRTDRLDRLWRSTRKHYARLRAEVLSLTVGRPEARTQRVPLLAIDGINYFANFTRAFYLSGALGCRSRNGKQISSGHPSVRSLRDAMTVAIQASARNNARWLPLTGPIERRLEPPWHDPNVLIKSAEAAKLSNYNDVLSAFSPFPKCIPDWACVRNFFAHRNADTYAAAMTVLAQNGLMSGRRISDLLLQPALGAARPLLWEWCAEIELRCEYLCS